MSWATKTGFFSVMVLQLCEKKVFNENKTVSSTIILRVGALCIYTTKYSSVKQ